MRTFVFLVCVVFTILILGFHALLGLPGPFIFAGLLKMTFRRADLSGRTRASTPPAIERRARRGLPVVLRHAGLRIRILVLGRCAVVVAAV